MLARLDARTSDARMSGGPGVRTPAPLIFNFGGHRGVDSEAGPDPNRQPLTQLRRRGPRHSGRKNCEKGTITKRTDTSIMVCLTTTVQKYYGT